MKSGSGGEDKWIVTTDEKLMDFCYKCGYLGNTLKECEKICGTNEEDLPYGLLLHEPIKLKARETDSTHNPSSNNQG